MWVLGTKSRSSKKHLVLLVAEPSLLSPLRPNVLRISSLVFIHHVHASCSVWGSHFPRTHAFYNPTFLYRLRNRHLTSTGFSCVCARVCAHAHAHICEQMGVVLNACGHICVYTCGSQRTTLRNPPSGKLSAHF